MALPEFIRVKLSSEAAGAISITPVVVQEMPLRELVEYMLGVAGKDHARVREILLRGTMVSGASRFRWAGWEAAYEDLAELLATFPDPEPSLPFDAGRCVRAVLRGGRQAIEIPRDAPGRRGTGNFWEALMLTVEGAAVYAGYSYRDRADRYRRDFGAAEIARLRAAGENVKYSTLREQLRAAGFSFADLYVPR
jgi:hypothetical protein